MDAVDGSSPLKGLADAWPSRRLRVRDHLLGPAVLDALELAATANVGRDEVLKARHDLYWQGVRLLKDDPPF